MGTRLMATQEVRIHNSIKQKAAKMDENQTCLIFRSYKNTARVYHNVVADEVAAIEAGGDFGQVHHLVSEANQEKARSTREIDTGIITVGMSDGLVKDMPSCEKLEVKFFSDAEHIIAELSVEITRYKKHIQYAPRSLATLVRNRMGRPKKASAEIGFTANRDLRKGSERLIEWHAKHIAKLQVRHEPVKWS